MRACVCVCLHVCKNMCKCKRLCMSVVEWVFWYVSLLVCSKYFLCICACTLCVHACVCVCECVREREREKKQGKSVMSFLGLVFIHFLIVHRYDKLTVIFRDLER